MRSLGHTAADATQIAGAIHDINASPDPLRHYAQAAQDTFAQGAGQALTALAGEGAAKTAPAVADTLASPTKMTAPLRAVAPAVNAALKRVPGAVGTAAGYAAGRATGLPEAGVLGGGLGYALTKDIPMPRIPENIGLPSRVEGGPATLPPEAADVTPPASDVLQAKQNAPAATATPQAVEQALNQALGGKPLVRGVSLRNQPAAQAAAAGKLPEGFTPVDSSVLKGYKYDPAAQEFTAVLKNGQTYTHGEVTAEQVKAFEDADSQGSAWTQQIRNNSPLVRKYGVPVKTATMESETGEIIPKAQAGALPQGIVIDPTTGRPQFSYDVAAKPRATPAVAAATPAAGEDLTAILQKSLNQAQAAKGLPVDVPRFVYRARDVGEEGVPLQPGSHGQATSSARDAIQYAEPGQRGLEQGQVVRIDLSQLKPSDYVVKTHPNGQKWVRFTRPLAEDEVTHFAGAGQPVSQVH